MKAIAVNMRTKSSEHGWKLEHTTLFEVPEPLEGDALSIYIDGAKVKLQSKMRPLSEAEAKALARKTWTPEMLVSRRAAKVDPIEAIKALPREALRALVEELQEMVQDKE